MRSRYIYNAQGDLIYAMERGEVVLDKRWESDDAPLVMPDIQPYQSMIDGTMITSRSQHREHLKAHGCIEIGNEKIIPRADLRNTGAKEALVRSIQQAKEKHGSRAVERAISEQLNRAYELQRNRR